MTIYLSEDEQKELEEWAASEKRAVSNLAVTIISRALEEHRQQTLKASNREEAN